jgi:peptide/nickel transport system substrate-binding protein
MNSKLKHAISRVATIIVVVIVVIIVAAGGYFAVTLSHTSTTSSTTSSTSVTTTVSSSSSSFSSSSATNTAVPSSLTWDTSQSYEYLDPMVGQDTFDEAIMYNVYETLLWYNGSSSTQVLPWLAQNYTVSPDGKSIAFTLRSGITFADGEPLNSSAIYFSFNRMLINDGSRPITHGTQDAYEVQQLLNLSLSWVYGAPHAFNSTWVNEVLGENFVQITGPLTFTLNIQNPNVAWPYILSGPVADILSPSYVMQHDLSTWSAAGYSLPYATLSGNDTDMMTEYYMDQVATCNVAPTAGGCGVTYLDNSAQGSQAGTGPYSISSVSQTSIVLQANANYWGGPSSNLKPSISTININYVPSVTTAEVNLKGAASSGAAFIADIPNTNLYDLASRNAWLDNNTLQSIIPGISLYGPYTSLTTNFVLYESNVTNPQTGTYYKFQPFADQRFRLAFSDAVNLTLINSAINNNLGEIAQNALPPGIPPAGSYNSNVTPLYSYNLTAATNLLLSAMENPITSFTFFNGTQAPTGYFSNAFGCTTLGSNNQCSNPISQTITMYYYSGDEVDLNILNTIATNINSISFQYNMGLQVVVEPLPFGQMIVEGVSHELYSWAIQFSAAYPWSTTLSGDFYYPSEAVANAASWNYSTLVNLYNQATAASGSNNQTGLVEVTNAMNTFANQNVMYLWTLYPETFIAMTSNISGFYYNQALGYGYIFAAMK